jgi:hypothetical protein
MEKYICDIARCNKEFEYTWDRKVDAGYSALCDKHKYLNYSCQDEEWDKLPKPKNAKCCNGYDCIKVFHAREMNKFFDLLEKK